MHREFHAPAPNKLWLSDFTYIGTWAGFVYVALVIDALRARSARPRTGGGSRLTVG